MLKWSVILKQTENKSKEAITISLIQHPEFRNNPENLI